jgi:hypothetical protein
LTVDVERTIVTLVLVLALCILAYVSGFQDSIVTILSTGVGAILGYWFGLRSGNGRSLG